MLEQTIPTVLQKDCKTSTWGWRDWWPKRLTFSLGRSKSEAAREPGHRSGREPPPTSQPATGSMQSRCHLRAETEGPVNRSDPPNSRNFPTLPTECSGVAVPPFKSGQLPFPAARLAKQVNGVPDIGPLSLLHVDSIAPVVSYLTCRDLVAKGSLGSGCQRTYCGVPCNRHSSQPMTLCD